MTDAKPAESEAVLAFMREHQPAVLDGAIAEISSCPTDDLPRVAHAWLGTLGSYRLDDAAAAVAGLQDAVREPGATPSGMDRARSEALVVLRSIDVGNRT
jgi:hypothetical protein